MSNAKKMGMEYGNIHAISSRESVVQYINLKLAAEGLPGPQTEYLTVFEDIISDYKEKKRVLGSEQIGIHSRLQNFFDTYFKSNPIKPKTPDRYMTLDRYGLARELSLPVNGDEFKSDIISSYRIKQGILNNPKNDRRTTEGSFHIVLGGLPVPNDKKEVPMETFVKLYQSAVNPPAELLLLPYTSELEEKAHTVVGLCVKPIVSTEIPGISEEKSMEVLFIAPGSLVSNLDFIESVFGNAGDPSIHVNDAGLDLEHWSGHTGFILLAPHLTKLKKIDLGLPHYDDASDRQRRDGMCYKDASELYNGGEAFKLTCRDQSGVAVTLIADNYYGYSKKEIKTQISFAANLYGNVEEEHAGGTIAFPRRNLGEHYRAIEDKSLLGYTFEEVKMHYHNYMEIMPEGYGVDREFPQVIYIPENIEVDLQNTFIKWLNDNEEVKIKIKPNHVYIMPNGDKIQMERHPKAPTWKLIGTDAEGTFCHKPCTVSGGGKSEISKSIENAIIYGTYFVNDLESDLDQVEAILKYDYRSRWKEYPERTRPSRPILSVERTLGSVIKLLSPSSAYSDAFNAYLNSIPNHVKALVFMVKRFYRQTWGDDWRSHFTVDIINGKPGNEINFDNRKVRPSYLRVGFSENNAWRVFKLRMDFMPSEKIQMEDDVTASITIPAHQLAYLNPEFTNPAVKFVANCEYRFFQRPDDAVHKGYDLKAEHDLSSNSLFATNFEPLTKSEVTTIKEDAMGFIAYTDAVRNHIDSFLESQYKYSVVSSESRLVDGKPSKNPRYLEHRMDFVSPIKDYVAQMGVRLSRKVPSELPVYMPVNAILPGRRNNPPGELKGSKVRPLSVYNPIHYQELPELFMDFISSLTGKSPSTTGAGSEGALTKGPFNMLLPIHDLNNALLSYILGDYHVFTTPAGHIGTQIRVDHDISILIPELWSRLSDDERNPKHLIEEGSFAKMEDFTYNGVHVPASILGYRMTDVFCYKYFGKIFDEPQTVFDAAILKPETQDMDAFVDGVLNIFEGHQNAALHYFEDGSLEYAIPPIKALLHIMAYGEYDGLKITDLKIRQMFDRMTVMNSEWYKERLENKQKIDLKLIENKIRQIKAFVGRAQNAELISTYGYDQRLECAYAQKAYIESNAYLDALMGTIGAEPLAL